MNKKDFNRDLDVIRGIVAQECINRGLNTLDEFILESRITQADIENFLQNSYKLCVIKINTMTTTNNICKDDTYGYCDQHKDGSCDIVIHAPLVYVYLHELAHAYSHRYGIEELHIDHGKFFHKSLSLIITEFFKWFDGMRIE